MENKYRVLIADDVEEMRELLKATIEPLGCSVDAEAEDGMEALRFIVTIQPDIVFLDINMPVKSGLDVLAEIKTMDLNVFPVIVSGHSTVSNVQEAIQLGARGFVVKPYSTEKIQQILEKFDSDQS
jgi:two-component system chemotaxis response regulator CheY